MKNYIGVKVVKAKPGTMAEAKAMKCKCPVEIPENILKRYGATNEEGYIVQEQNGVITWLSKEDFEKAYILLDCEKFINNKQSRRKR